MPETLTVSHILLVLAGVVMVYALWQASIFLKHASAGRGTPQYARRRDGRRYAIWGSIVVFILLALGWLTPLGEMAIS